MNIVRFWLYYICIAILIHLTTPLEWAIFSTTYLMGWILGEKFKRWIEEGETEVKE